MTDDNVELPAGGWRPRPYQMGAWSALERGVTRAAIAAHRRWGKDDVCLHWAARSAILRPAPYWHMLPQASQARKAIWDAVNPHTGRRRIDEAFPLEIRMSTREQDMFIRFVNGATWQVIGSDNYNSLVGSPPAGVVFSEYALADPSAWAFIRPILAENGGWAVFISTPRGRNHFARLVEYALRDAEWYGEVSTVADTGAISQELINRERRELVAERGPQEAEALIRQEYFCDFDAAIPGAYYGELMSRAAREGRIGDFPWLSTLPVGIACDIGYGDQTVLWFYQQLPSGRIRIIDVLVGSGVEVAWYAQRIVGRPYTIVDTIWPHDGGHGDMRGDLVHMARDLGWHPVRVLDRDPTVDVGIQAVRAIFPMLEFNETPIPFGDETPDDARQRMSRALDAIRGYRRQWDEKRQRFADSPLHDWCFTGETEVLTRYGMQPIIDLPQFGEVLTSCGWKPYANPRITRRDAQLVEVRFTDGLSVRCTPDHLFKTDSGWKSAESLTQGCKIQSSLTPSRSIGMAVYTAFFRAQSISREEVSSCIVGSGLRRLATSLLAVRFITETATQRITRSRIWSALRAASIGPLHGMRTRICTVLADSMGWLESVPRNGIAPRRASFGTRGMPNEQRAGPSGSASPLRALTATLCSIASSARTGVLKNTAPKTARWLTIEHVKPLPEKADVWCLTVPDAEEFSLRNGAIVHNCSDYADALRYLARGRRPFDRRGPSNRPRQAVADYAVLG